MAKHLFLLSPKWEAELVHVFDEFTDLRDTRIDKHKFCLYWFNALIAYLCNAFKLHNNC